MAIKHIVTRGYGNGMFSGTIPLVTLRGYGIGAAAVIVAGPFFIQAAQAHTPGSVSSQSHTPGGIASQAHAPGSISGQAM